MNAIKNKNALSENECNSTIFKGIKKALKEDKKEFKGDENEIVVPNYTKKAASKMLINVIGKPIDQITIGIQLTEVKGCVFIRGKYKG